MSNQLKGKGNGQLNELAVPLNQKILKKLRTNFLIFSSDSFSG
jgi:hypothetical protein